MREIQIDKFYGDHPHLQAFGEALLHQDMATSTIRSYGYDLAEFFRWMTAARGDSAGPDKIEGIDIYRYRDYLLDERRLSTATINRRLESLRRFCRWAHQEKILKIDPTVEMRPIRKAKRYRPKGLKRRETQALLRAAGVSSHGLSIRNYALVQLFLQTGLRVGEAAALIVEDVVLRDRMGQITVRGKGEKQRDVPLNAAARRGLSRYLESRGELAPNAPVFESSRGRAMSVRSMQHTVSVLAQRAKLDRITVSAHTLRHTFALEYLRDNPGKLVELASLMGHESLDTTFLYTRPSMEDLAESLERNERDH